MHLHICRPHSLVDRNMRSTFTCILDSLPVLGMVQTKRWLGYSGESVAERSAKDRRKLHAGARTEQSRQVQMARANDSDCSKISKDGVAKDS